MNPDLLDLELPIGEIPELAPRHCSAEQNDHWQLENRRLRLLRGDDNSGLYPVPIPFTMEDKIEA